ncbi:efflux RND transporter periplasmic adaptor subunit [Paenibacillus gorillae]|uniref:efflux RND transporter periplasmic adaptor subunit n=1 Tax=Paenibacillus gorillae TaxID=1243662 RepID=UPI0004B36BBE|nr:biotin/lipoyl-binding protein [Paenibacillus gorillae]
MELSQEQVDRKRKKWISVLLLLLLGALLFFTLFSNTLQSVTLPKVSTKQAESGGVSYKLESSGVLQPVNQVELSNPAGWRVRQVLVKKGQAVKKGQKLVLYDSSSAERELEDEIAQLKKQSIALENVQDQFKLSVVNGDESAVREARRDLETRNIDILVQQRKIDELRDQLNRQKELTAPFNGIVMKLNAVEGLAATGQPDLVVSNLDLGYGLNIIADGKLLDRFSLAVKQSIDMKIAAEGEQPARSLKGIIVEISDASSQTDESSNGGSGAGVVRQKQLRIHVADTDLKGGEQVTVKLERVSSGKGWLVPNEAIHREGESRFILKVEQQRGALGNVFVARKVPIETSEETEQETMISKDRLYEGEMIILESSEPLQDGNRIRLE